MSAITHDQETSHMGTGKPLTLDPRGILSTPRDRVQTLLRVTLGVVILPHGLQKLFGWFGGYGFAGTMDFLTGAVGLPWLVGLSVILFESVGALGLILGAGGRAWAAGIGAVMVGAIMTTHVEHGFFMNWSGAQGGEGFEFHLLALALAAAVVVRGSGAFSVDRAVAGRDA